MSSPDRRSIVHALAYWAAKDPDRVAFKFVSAAPQATGIETAPTQLTYAGLNTWALAIAAEIAEHAINGQTAVILYPQGPQLLAHFFACLYARVIPILLYPPRPKRRDDRLMAVLQNANTRLILAPQAVADRLKSNLNDAGLSPVLQLEAVVGAFASAGFSCSGEMPFGDPGSDDVAFLQYTSGSTQNARGVVVSHANLIENIEMIVRRFGWGVAIGLHLVASHVS